MRRRQYIPSSSEFDVKYKPINSGNDEPDGKNVQTTSLEGNEEVESNNGKHLTNEILKLFCEKVRMLCPTNIEGLFDIQSPNTSDLAGLKDNVSGNSVVVQVLHDVKKSNYILVSYHPGGRHVRIYDSVQRCTREGKPKIALEIGKCLVHIFGHLYDENIPIVIDGEYEAENDFLFCGYRAIGALIDIARGNNPAKYSYNPKQIFEFVRKILNEPKPTWEMFTSAKLGTKKEYSGEYFWDYSMNKNVLTKVSSSSVNSKSILASPVPKEISVNCKEARIAACGEPEDASIMGRILRSFRI